MFSAIRHERGADGLWKSICKIIKHALADDEDVIVICEDDHTFTADYNREKFLHDVIEAGHQGCQIMLGGIGNLANAIPVSDRRWWISWFWSTQFMVVYKSAFKDILNADFGVNDVADEFLANLLTHKQVLWPFISIQHDFGYSDVTVSNNNPLAVSKLFEAAQQRLSKLDAIRRIM